MKTYAFCPISDKNVNERVARLNAGITVMLLLFFIITHNIIAVIFMTIDFFLRASGYSKLSPVSIISKYIIKWLPLKDHFINAGPKILAARIGLIFSILIIVSLLMSFSYLPLFIAGILGLFSFLEGAFGLCVACQIYPFVYRFLYSENYKK